MAEPNEFDDFRRRVAHEERRRRTLVTVLDVLTALALPIRQNGSLWRSKSASTLRKTITIARVFAYRTQRRTPPFTRSSRPKSRSQTKRPRVARHNA